MESCEAQRIDREKKGGKAEETTATSSAAPTSHQLGGLGNMGDVQGVTHRRENGRLMMMLKTGLGGVTPRCGNKEGRRPEGRPPGFRRADPQSVALLVAPFCDASVMY
ncbi:unnamed protein product [Lota lota]